MKHNTILLSLMFSATLFAFQPGDSINRLEIKSLKMGIMNAKDDNTRKGLIAEASGEIEAFKKLFGADEEPEKDSEFANKISSGFSGGDAPIMHAVLYEGFVASDKTQFALLTALSDYDSTENEKKAAQLTLDPSGGLINFNLTPWYWTHDYFNNNGNKGLFEIRAGVKLDQLEMDNNGTNATEDLAVPYLGIGYFAELSIFSKDKKPAGYWQMGVTLDYEYINDDLKGYLDGEVSNNEGVLSLYSDFVVQNQFGISFVYSTVLSHLKSVENYYFAFTFRP